MTKRIPLNGHDVFCARCGAYPGFGCRRPTGKPMMGYHIARHAQVKASRKLARGEKQIPLAKCVDRRVYALAAWNLSLGVYVLSMRAFIGIREKGGRSLDREFHVQCGPPHGTAYGHVDVGWDVPDEIKLLVHDDDVPWPQPQPLFTFLDVLGKRLGIEQ